MTSHALVRSYTYPRVGIMCTLLWSSPKKNTSHGNEVLVTSIFLYACEWWTLTAELQRRTQAKETRCYYKILHISYKDCVTKRCKLQWYGHVFHSSGWPKPSCKAQWKGEEHKADRGKGGKTTSGNGQAWSSQSPWGQWRKGKMEETSCEIICGAPVTLVVKGQMK